MAEKGFFEQPRPQSLVKSRVVSQYFGAWSGIMQSVARTSTYRGDGRIAYLDLYAGPGYYADGTESTPLLVLKQVLASPYLRDHLVTLFNDKSRTKADSLRQAIAGLPGIDQLRFEPEITSLEVGQQIVDQLGQRRLVPSLLFADPWGYKGLSLTLLKSVLKDWGCDCMFFLNCERINRDLTNPRAAKKHIDSLFGVRRAEQLRAIVDRLSPYERRVAVREAICEAVKEVRGDYVLPFAFYDDSGHAVRHYLVFASKSAKAYEKMKGIMARASSRAAQGVPAYAYCPADESQPQLLPASRPLDDLERLLVEEFGGRTLSVSEVYRQHGVGTQYIPRNYKMALLSLETQGLVTISRRTTSRRRDQLGDAAIVTFR